MRDVYNKVIHVGDYVDYLRYIDSRHQEFFGKVCEVKDIRNGSARIMYKSNDLNDSFVIKIRGNQLKKLTVEEVFLRKLEQ
jgi:hypothetical protein